MGGGSGGGGNGGRQGGGGDGDDGMPVDRRAMRDIEGTHVKLDETTKGTVATVKLDGSDIAAHKDVLKAAGFKYGSMDQEWSKIVTEKDIGALQKIKGARIFSGNTKLTGPDKFPITSHNEHKTIVGAIRRTKKDYVPLDW